METEHSVSITEPAGRLILLTHASPAGVAMVLLLSFLPAIVKMEATKVDDRNACGNVIRSELVDRCCAHKVVGFTGGWFFSTDTSTAGEVRMMPSSPTATYWLSL